MDPSPHVKSIMDTMARVVVPQHNQPRYKRCAPTVVANNETFFRKIKTLEGYAVRVFLPPGFQILDRKPLVCKGCSDAESVGR